MLTSFQFKDGVFMVTTWRSSPTIFISPNFLPELKKLPDATLSMEAAVDESMETKSTKIETPVPIIPYTIKGELTPSLSRLSLTIASEVRDSMNLTMPPCDDWTEFNIHHALLRIVGMVSGRMFISPELCHSEQYLDAAINYTMEVMGAQRAVQNMRPWLRPFRAQSLPELIDRKDKFPDKDSQNLAKVQLGLTFAAVHTTTLTATNCVELREKARKVLSQSGGQFTSNVLQSMKKMDSFLKETLRVHPATMASFQRKVLKPFTLSNGQVIPAGVTIEIPAVAVSSDPNVFPHAEKFDPLRFYRLRTETKDGGVTFGYGRHACPGRFFAANEIKMILAHALLQYDVKNIGGATERCPNMEFAHMSIPDPSNKLLFKSIEI
ncbi:cycloheximide-inducible CIP70 (cytochrome P450 family) [Fusarium sp. NRRL 52700]|nr:cycloheximide-inducible CIP70 (cytochrome P450 family) [Fusarium sp. NRRL 52700]